MKNKFLCVHGHFYQPPRENPWLEEVEEEPSAAPYHDWNERIFHECYGPNIASAVLDGRALAEALLDNYRLISFNLGPTLLSWLERRQPHAYRALLAADRASARTRGGHGNALAQAYNHVILPLASLRDKRTQVRWGLADFRRRFGRDAEGLWLPECAADDETLEVLA
ncbi:MAG: glycoside hydrolase, partial [Elusimicrobia bacterium]|nr:glycoside hydrolase [Elusimicrobiota bacterium]